MNTNAVASSLNPEAGSHPIPSDPREIEAAIRAGQECLKHVPYFEARYGERGRRFASSDGAWLVTLSELEQAQTHEQVLWLGRVLASRGMPRLTLEVHLRMLFEELCRAVPERSSQYARLNVASRELGSIRRQHIDEASFQALCDQFEAALAPHSRHLAKIGPLLVSAVADEKAGLKGGVDSLRDWLTDNARFSTEWVAAVQETLTRARACAIPGCPGPAGPA